MLVRCLSLLALAVFGSAAVAEELPPPDRRMEVCWEKLAEEKYSPRTGLFYGVNLDQLPKPEQFIPRERYLCGDYRTKPYRQGDEKSVGYNSHGGGSGMEDCTLFTGTMLASQCDRYLATKDPRCADTARMAYKGLKNVATVPGQPGMIFRGLCHEDGRSFFAGTSRDQYTNAIYAMWRFYHSGLADETEKEEIRRILSEVAEKMIREITPENSYSFRFGYGIPDDRGTGRMHDPEAPSYMTRRLAMFYAAAADVTASVKYQEHFLHALKECMGASRNWTETLRKNRYAYPAYVVAQEGYALRLIYEVVKAPEWKERVLAESRIMADFIRDFGYYSERKGRDYFEITNGLLCMPGGGLSPEQAERFRSYCRGIKPAGWTGYYGLLGAYWQARSQGVFDVLAE